MHGEKSIGKNALQEMNDLDLATALPPNRVSRDSSVNTTVETSLIIVSILMRAVLQWHA
jgi:hypothetical protein